MQKNLERHWKMDKPIASVSQTRAILDEFQAHAKKSFGQNFLVDASVVKKTAGCADAGGAVIEIGPGLGALTQQLALLSQHVTAYEIDSAMMQVLAKTLHDYDNVEIIHQDFLECDLEEKIQELKQKYGTVSVCSNLPYCITSPVLFRLFESSEEIQTITVMVQKEVADRFLAGPGSEKYGAISVEGGYLYTCARIMQVKASCFMPAPKVDSTVIQFRRKENPIPVEDRDAFFSLIKGCFKQRRKTIYNNLKEYLGDAELARTILQEAEIDESSRAQQCSLEEFCRLDACRTKKR